MSLEVYRAALKAVTDCMAVKPGEQVVVVTDSLMPRSIPESLASAAGAAGADATIVVLTPGPARTPKSGQEQPSFEPSPPAAAAIAAAHALFSLTHPILNGTNAETAALRNGARVLRMLLWDFYLDRTEIVAYAAEIEASFLRAFAIDLSELADLTQRATVALAQGRAAHITTQHGTDLRIEMDATLDDPETYYSPVVWPNPVQCCDGLCHDPGTWDEAAGGVVGVLCTNAEGTIVIDHSIPPFGLLREPIAIRVEDRRAVAFEGGREAQVLERWLAAKGNENVYVCPAEWGVGTHRACIDSGNFLEHEKAYGTIHVALGDDMRFGGGHSAPIHIDGVLTGARLEVDGNVILDDGEFNL
jgi:leucyl aminopeptidase (aminopeptidase T)